jgi:cytochrome c556
MGLVLTLAVAGQPSFAGEFDKQVKARKSLMQVYAFNLGILGAMAKGEMDYNADVARAGASNLHAAASMKNPTMWPKGSGSDALGDTTRAKPEIWSTYPKISEKGKDLVAAAARMANVAGNGVDAVKRNMKAVGDACKGCHESFRVPKKK